MKVVLSIAGSDSSGGAGIQADLKTFEAHGVFGASAITALTAQNTTGVSDISALKPDFVAAQIKMVLQDFEVSAIKIGMLFSKEIIVAVRECIKDYNGFVVLDPVFIAKSKAKLLKDSAIEELKTLFQYATVATPNSYEAKVLFPSGAENYSFPCDVLVKNADGTNSIDRLYCKNEIIEFSTPRLQTNSNHGAGCSFSSAIAANLALGHNLKDSIALSKKFVFHAIKMSPNIGRSNSPLGHKDGFWQMTLEQNLLKITSKANLINNKIVNF